MEKSNQVAIVTGASGGIGRAVALRLSHDGFAVVAHYSGNAAKAEEAVTEIKAAGGRGIAVRADVANVADVERLFKEALAAFGAINVVVNCAGIMPLGRIDDSDIEMFDKVIATNLRGAFIVLGQAAHHVARGGRIIAFSTSVIAKAFPTYGPYIASKAGVEGLVHVLANELRGRNITVNAVAPGPVPTELFLADKTEAQLEQMRKLPPLERLGQVEDIANVVSFLAGPEGGWINAQVVRTNGGFA
jgi:3-oxoacyl-[acyl-carrier protein] reductase